MKTKKYKKQANANAENTDNFIVHQKYPKLWAHTFKEPLFEREKSFKCVWGVGGRGGHGVINWTKS